MPVVWGKNIKQGETKTLDKENKYTNEDLKTMQAWSLERKIQVTQTRILEFGLKFNEQIYVSFSGGKDSTVLLDLVRRVFPDTPAVFIDTGLEYPEIREFVKTVQNTIWLKPGMNFKKVIEKYGYPLISKEVAKRVYYGKKFLNENGTVGKWAYASLTQQLKTKDGKKSPYDYHHYRNLLDAPFAMSNACCDEMKKKTIHAYERKTGRKPLIGTMACESRQRKVAWIKTGCNAFEGSHPKSQPMSFWTEQDVLEYIKRFHLPYASVYGEILQDEKGKYYTTGCSRTGCIFCGFGCHLEKEPNRFQRLKQTHPKLWEYCMKPWDEGGLGMKEVLEYINVKIE